MDIVKKNILSILCGVVAIICIALVFYPFGGLYNGLTAEVTKSKSTGDQIMKVKTEPRTWPTLSPNPEDVVPLKHFPTQPTIDIGKKQTESWTQEASDFFNHAVAVQKDNLKLLVPGSLPGVPGQTAVAYNFLDEYKKIFALTANGGPSGPAGAAGISVTLPPGGALGVLPGGMPPSDADITARTNDLVDNIKATMPKMVDGKVFNQDEIDEAVKKAQTDTARKMRQDVALQQVVYLDPVQSFQPDAHIAANALVAPTVNDIFNAQVGLWIQQEICRAIAETNAGAKAGVLDAPIKRLIGVRLTLPYVALPPAPGQAVAEPLPAPVTPPQARVAVDFVKNPLGHVSNDFYDVIPFQIAIVCEAETLPTTLTMLTRNRYIMVRSLDVLSIDSAVAYAQGFIYGDKPVVQLNMRCQYLMLRRFLGPLMPQDVIRGLTAPVTAQPQ